MIPADLLDAAQHLRADLLRNIVSIRQGQNLFDDLSDRSADWAAAIAAEVATRPRQPVPAINRPFENGYGVAVDFPFARGWTRTRFSDGTFGVWYGSPELETTVYETAHHFRRQLQDTDFSNRGPVVRERKVYLVAADAVVFDLRAKCDAYPALLDPVDYGFTHEVGRTVAAGRHPGLWTRSARCGGECVAIFDPRYLGNVRDHCFLTYTYDPGTASIEVERQPGVVWMTVH